MPNPSPTTPKSSMMQQANFLLLCGLVLQDSRDRKVFEKMEEEVGNAAERLLGTIQIEQAEAAESPPAARAPTGLITETAMQTEISRTFELASVETKAIYDLGGGDEGGDWMIRWMLWGRITRAAQ